jgi:hypothetical protein
MQQSEEEMRAVMDGTGLTYEILASGQARMIIDGLGPNRDRSQVVLVQNFLDAYGTDYRDRDVSAAVADMAKIPKSSELMKKLLENIGEMKAGCLYVRNDRLFFRLDVPLTASVLHLRDAIFYCAAAADELEHILTSGKYDDCAGAPGRWLHSRAATGKTVADPACLADD